MNCSECDARTYRTVAGRPLCADCDLIADPAYFAQADKELTRRIEEGGRL